MNLFDQYTQLTHEVQQLEETKQDEQVRIKRTLELINGKLCSCKKELRSLAYKDPDLVVKSQIEQIKIGETKVFTDRDCLIGFPFSHQGKFTELASRIFYILDEYYKKSPSCTMLRCEDAGCTSDDCRTSHYALDITYSYKVNTELVKFRDLKDLVPLDRSYILVSERIPTKTPWMHGACEPPVNYKCTIERTS